MKSLFSWLRHPVDGASLAVFRILFGALLVAELLRAWPTIRERFTDASFHFKYLGLEWVHAWPGEGMYWHFAALVVAALYIALGLLYRFACALFFVLYAYVFLIDQALYTDASYFACLLAFLLCWLPADRAWSVDARWKGTTHAATVPRWAPLSVQLLLVIVLVSSGAAKLNADWLAGYPLALRLSEFVAFFGLYPSIPGWVAIAASAVVVIVQCVGAPLLFVRRYRMVALGAVGLVQLAATAQAGAGLMPLTVVAGLVLFPGPAWPRQWFGSSGAMEPESPGAMSWRERVAVSVIAFFLLYNVLMPLRPLLYQGEVAWTGEGARFSWRAGVDDKPGEVAFLMRNPRTQQGWPIKPDEYLTPEQIEALIAQPDLVIQFAHHLAGIWRTEHGIADIQSFARVYVSLNGRPHAPLVDQTHDLAKTERSPGHAKWILGLDPELSPGSR